MHDGIPFNEHNLDRASEKRGDPGWMAERLQDDASLFLPLWRGRPLIKEDGRAAAAGWISRTTAEDLRSGGEPYFLGLGPDGAARFVFDASHLEGPEPTGPLADKGRFEELRGAAMRVAPEEAGVLAHAKSLSDWHARHRFCAACGALSEVADGGAKRKCPACGSEHFPRVDPVAITLVIDGEKCLLARGPQWPEGLFSALAGFLEPGETVEGGAAREVFEEAGVRVRSVRIVANQPWPWPSSLMVGCLAEAETNEIRIDGEEISEARWFDRAEAATMLERALDDGSWAPPPVAIAHHLMRSWLNGD